MSNPSVGALSPNGTVATFYSDDSEAVPRDVHNAPDMFLRDLRTGAVELVDVTTDGQQAVRGVDAFRDALSADGRFVVFRSEGTGLAPGGGDLYVRDR